MNWDYLIHGCELVLLLPVLWKANRFFNRFLDERENFPPHRHGNGKIYYPKGLKPEKPEEQLP